jgi:site-specific DNA recombinase
MEDLNRRGIRSKVRVAKNGKRSGGNRFFRGALYEMLANPIYIGEIRHKDVRHPGLHESIIDRALWDSTQLLLRSHAAPRTPRVTKSAPSPLTGRLFDDRGQSLTPTYATKDERRYRYYVPRNLIDGTTKAGPGGWRLPAFEIERIVSAAVATMLADEAAVVNTALASGLAERELPSVLASAAAWVKRLQSAIEVGAALPTLVNRVDLIDSGLRVFLKLPISVTEKQLDASVAGLGLTRIFPMQIRRRGFEMRLIIQGSRAPAPLADLALIKAIMRGRQWADDLLAGRVASIAAIAGREAVLPNYVRRLTRLAFLAPAIVEAIVAGRQPPELTAKALTERLEFAASLERARTCDRHKLVSEGLTSHLIRPHSLSLAG